MKPTASLSAYPRRIWHTSPFGGFWAFDGRRTSSDLRFHGAFSDASDKILKVTQSLDAAGTAAAASNLGSV